MANSIFYHYQSLFYGKNIMKRIFSAAVVLILVAGCAGEYNRAQSGAAIGAAGGAILGQAIGL